MCPDAHKLSLERVSVTAARDEMASGGAGGTLYIDVREPEEFARSRIEGMQNIPLSELFLRRRDWESAPRVVLFCQQGNRSAVASRTACRLGFSNVVDIEGGLMSWITAGLPVRRE
jgi:rhodanese-related sulfurtransferase